MRITGQEPGKFCLDQILLVQQEGSQSQCWQSTTSFGYWTILRASHGFVLPQMRIGQLLEMSKQEILKCHCHFEMVQER